MSLRGNESKYAALAVDLVEQVERALEVCDGEELRVHVNPTQLPSVLCNPVQWLQPAPYHGKAPRLGSFEVGYELYQVLGLGLLRRVRVRFRKSRAVLGELIRAPSTRPLADHTI